MGKRRQMRQALSMAVEKEELAQFLTSPLVVVCWMSAAGSGLVKSLALRKAVRRRKRLFSKG